MVMLLVEVLTRYILRSPLSIAEEMGGYLLVSITFMGLAYTWKEKGHVRVTLIFSRLPEKDCPSDSICYPDSGHGFYPAAD